jgi:hypothetical protein
MSIERQTTSQPITPQVRFAAAFGLVFWLAIIIVVGVLLLRWIGRNSPSRKQHGRYVLGWMVLGWVAGGCAGLWIIESVADYSLVDFGYAGFGLLAGWVVGMVHGGVALLLTKRRVRKTG